MLPAWPPGLASGQECLSYSDNVSLDDEIALKQLAAKDLVVMGPIAQPSSTA
jgi:hypothetical protein